MVSNNLRRIRKDRNLTQEQLAARLYVTRQTISNWETGRSQPSVEEMTVLADALKTDIHELIFGNRKDGYPKYQTRYIRRSLLWGAVLAALIVSRGALLQHYACLMDRYLISTFWGSVLVPFLSEALIGLALGFFCVSVLSVWFRCETARKRLAASMAVIFLLPVLRLLLESPVFAKLSDLSFLLFVLSHGWARTLLFFVLPFASGTLFCLLKASGTGDHVSADLR